MWYLRMLARHLEGVAFKAAAVRRSEDDAAVRAVLGRVEFVCASLSRELRRELGEGLM